MASVLGPQEGRGFLQTKVIYFGNISLDNPKAQCPCRSIGVLLGGGTVDDDLHWDHVGVVQSAFLGALHVCTSRDSMQSWQRTAQHQWNLHSHLVIRVTREVS